MNSFFTIAFILAAMLIPWPVQAAENRGVSGAFIQLNRQAASRSPEQWKALLSRMRTIGIDTLIIQWTAEAPVLYFKDKNLDFQKPYDAVERLMEVKSNDRQRRYGEQYDAVERLMEAGHGMRFSILLGLQNDPTFWREITGRDKVLRDYFLERLAQNERLQAALLRAFGTQTNWVGYYIPDEIDDLTWRTPARQRLLKDYLRQTIRSIKARDGNRSVAISAFVRVRTAPDLAAGMLRSLTTDIGLDTLLIQDGAGVNNPPPDVIHAYYHALRYAGPWHKLQLWAVLEAFRQTSANNAPFAAEPAPPDGFSEQIQAASEFERRVVFTFPDYTDPERGPAAHALYERLRETSGLANSGYRFTSDDPDME